MSAEWPLKAEKTPRKKARFRPHNDNIAAIDFGTTCCSLAYTTKGDPNVATVRLNSFFPRVPTAILLKVKDDCLSVSSDGQLSPPYQVAAFGYRAQEEHSNISDDEHHKYLYFERMKMSLQHDKCVERDMTVKAFNGRSYFLMEVIAFILSHLKDILMGHLSPPGVPILLSAMDFEWVITVPAIWKARAKRMMREAAYLAGLCSEGQAITQFHVTDKGIKKAQENNPDKLSLALEPEVAAIYCQHMETKDIAGHSVARSEKPHKYIVADVGGGTVDITVHKLDSSTGVEVLSLPAGNDWGGTTVNLEFSKLLQKIVRDEGRDEGFPAFLSDCPPQEISIRRAAINELLFNKFETEKLSFGEKADGMVEETPAREEKDYISVRLPEEFTSYYSSNLIESQVSKQNDQGIEYNKRSGKLYIKFSKVRDLLKPAVDGVLECLTTALRSIGTDINTVYLVGGFGGCKYMYEKVLTKLDSEFGKNRFEVIVPEDHHIAVVQGAVLFRKKPDIIRSRRVDATYGTDALVPFDPNIHDSDYKLALYPHCPPVCRDVFLIYMEKGEVAKADEVVTARMSPTENSVTTLRVDIFATAEQNVNYIKDKKGSYTVQKVGQFVIDIPNSDNLTQEQSKEVEITMDFGHTEIQVRGQYLANGNEVKTTIDFLSSQAFD